MNRAGTPRNLKKPWAKGVSGNPGGRPKKLPVTEIYERILSKPENRKLIEETVLRIIRGGRMSSVLVLKEIAERLEGKVSQPVQLDGEISLTVSERLRKGLDGKGATPLNGSTQHTFKSRSALPL